MEGPYGPFISFLWNMRNSNLKYCLLKRNLICLFVVLSIGGCSVLGFSENQSDQTAVSSVELAVQLQAAGAIIEPAGHVSQPFFSVKGSTIRMNGEDIQVFEYQKSASANREAASVSGDGSSVGTTMISWVDDPHFYKKDKRIVLYVGDNLEILIILNQVLGPQFAGR